MKNKEEHLRMIAVDALVHLPLDHHDALKVLDYMHFLVNWRHKGATHDLSSGEESQ